MRPANGIRRFKLHTRYDHKRSEGLRSTRKHPTRVLVRRKVVRDV